MQGKYEELSHSEIENFPCECSTSNVGTCLPSEGCLHPLDTALRACQHPCVADPSLQVMARLSQTMKSLLFSTPCPTSLLRYFWMSHFHFLPFFTSLNCRKAVLKAALSALPQKVVNPCLAFHRCSSPKQAAGNSPVLHTSGKPLSPGIQQRMFICLSLLCTCV